MATTTFPTSTPFFAAHHQGPRRSRPSISAAVYGGGGRRWRPLRVACEKVAALVLFPSAPGVTCGGFPGLDTEPEPEPGPGDDNPAPPDPGGEGRRAPGGGSNVPPSSSSPPGDIAAGALAGAGGWTSPCCRGTMTRRVIRCPASQLHVAVERGKRRRRGEGRCTRFLSAYF